MSPKHIDASEFRATGFLQEANRQFFHPLGLALEVAIEDDGTEHIGGVWDYREDSEGIYFGDEIDPAKAQAVEAERLRHHAHRIRLFGGSAIQPIKWGRPTPPAPTKASER